MKDCRYCGAIISINEIFCSFCNENTTYEIPKEIKNCDINEIIEKINLALKKMEMFCLGNVDFYNYFGFAVYFEKLYFEIKNNPENWTIKNQNLLYSYFALLNQIYYDYDKDRYENKNVNTNEDFYKDINELGAIYNDTFRFNIIESNNSFDSNYDTPRYTIFDLINEQEEVQLKELPIEKSKTIKANEKYKHTILFKVGLLFAKGEMNKYFTVNNMNITVMNKGFSALKIAEELGNKSYNKFILASINNYSITNSNGNKNIFNSLDIMTKVIDQCKIDGINVMPYFLSRLPIE